MNIKNIILCADDYGLNTCVSQGIIDLLQRQHLSAVSCLSTAPLWMQAAASLKPFHHQADIGLHFNLTEGRPLSAAYCKVHGGQFFSLPELIFRAFFRQLNVEVLEQECEAQLKRFTEGVGFLPDFIDGHQHVHQLPIVRTALLRVYKKHLRHKNAYVRSVCKQPRALGLNNKIKKFIIYLCGSSALQRLLQSGEVPHNSSFAGVYSFSKSVHYDQIFPVFLKNIKDKGLIMCHPGLRPNSLGVTDPIAAARFQEYSYLSSEQFVSDCKRLGVRLVRAGVSA